MIREIQRAILDDEQHNQRDAERLWYGHMRDMNPTAMRDHARQKLIDTAWNIAAFFALILFFGWLASLKA